MVEVWMPTVSLAPGISVNHYGLACYRDEVHLVYEDSGNVQYRKSVNEGSTFSTAVTIASTNELALTSPIAVDGQYVHVIYTRDSNNASLPPKLYYRRSVDGGTTWDSEVTLDDGTGVANNRFMRVCVVAEAGYVHVFWTTIDTSTFVFDVLSYRRSTDNGTTFAAETALAGSTGAGRPDAVLVGPTIHLVWTDTREGSTGNGGETFYVRSDDRGATWGTEVNLSNTSENNTIRATVTAIGPRVVVAWQYPAGTPGSEDIIWSYSSDSGATWSTAATLVTGTGAQHHPSLRAQAGVVAMCWTNDNDTPDRSYAKFSRDYGVTWTTAQALFVPAANTAAPTLGFTSRFVQVVDADTATPQLTLSRSPIFEPDPSQELLLDDFNRADDATPPPGTNWTNGITTFTGGEGIAIVSNQACRASAGGYRQGGYHNVKQFTHVDVVAEVSAWANVTNAGFAVYARLQQIGSGTTDGYGLDLAYNGTTTDWAFWRVDNITPTDLVPSFTRAIAANDKVALTCRRDLIMMWHRASSATEWTQVAAVIDATYGSGYTGLEFLNDQTVKITNLWASNVFVPVDLIRKPNFVYMRKNR